MPTRSYSFHCAGYFTGGDRVPDFSFPMPWATGLILDGAAIMVDGSSGKMPTSIAGSYQTSTPVVLMWMATGRRSNSECQ